MPSFIPEGKTYSAITSLETQVLIAAGIQIWGQAGFWTEIGLSLGFNLDPNLLNILQSRGSKKKRLRLVHGSINYANVSKVCITQLDRYNEGTLYKSNIAIATVKRNLKNAYNWNTTRTLIMIFDVNISPH